MESIHYTIRISPFSQKIIIKQLMIAVGLPFGALLVLLVSLKAWYALVFVLFFLFISTIFVMAIYGHYSLRVLIDQKGILCEPDREQRTINQRLNALTVIAGMFAKIPVVSGAGVLASANQTQFFEWESIRAITQDKGVFIITHKNKQVLLLNYPKHLLTDIRNAMLRRGKDI